MTQALLAAAAIVAVVLLWRAIRWAGGKIPRVGDAAPAFRLPDQHGELRASSEFRGRWLVLYFYPKDDTPGCVEQALRFRDAMAGLQARGAAVCGVSLDDSGSHAAFARKYQLDFPLLADAGGTTAARYGSLRDLGVVKFARRNTFLIDPQGFIAQVWLGASPARNATDVAAALDAAAG